MITVIHKNQTFITFERATRTNQPHLSINGQQILLLSGQTYLIDPIAMLTAGGSFSSLDRALRFDLEFPETNHKVMITAHLGDFGVQWLQVYPKPPISSKGKTSGLLGNYNDNPNDDFQDLDGVVHPLNISHDQFYGKFVESWRFTGNIANLEPSNDLGEPSIKTPMSIQDYPLEEVTKARKLCSDVTAGFAQGCVLDYLLTGDKGVASAYSFIDGVVGVTALVGGKEVVVSASPTTQPPSTATPTSSSSGVNVVAIVVPCVIGGILVIGVLIFLFVWRGNKQPRSQPRDNLSV